MVPRGGPGKRDERGGSDGEVVQGVGHGARQVSQRDPLRQGWLAPFSFLLPNPPTPQVPRSRCLFQSDLGVSVVSCGGHHPQASAGR